jgi:predicted GIY-YIG superfamily endonuclease
LYVGVTNDLVRRVYEHTNKFVRGHAKNYKIDRLVYFEIHETAYQAISGNTAREEHQALAESLEDAADRQGK